MALDLPRGSVCFIDANIFYYHFVETPGLSSACSGLIHRVSDGELSGFTSTHMVSEAVHKIMLAEVATTFGLNRAGLVNWLQKHSEKMSGLSVFQQAAAEMMRFGLEILQVELETILAAAKVSCECGLLTNDALIVALMRRHGIAHLVTNDGDFDALPSLRIWKPRENS